MPGRLLSLTRALASIGAAQAPPLFGGCPLRTEVHPCHASQRAQCGSVAWLWFLDPPTCVKGFVIGQNPSILPLQLTAFTCEFDELPWFTSRRAVELGVGACRTLAPSHPASRLLLRIVGRGLPRFLFATAAEKYKQPSRLSPVIDAINARLREYAEAQERVTYVDCNAVLLEVGGGGEVRVFLKKLLGFLGTGFQVESRGRTLGAQAASV